MATRKTNLTLVGPSPAMAKLRRFVEVAAETDVPVLIEGETGTGKTMVARMIHEAGPRSREPFVAVNCAGMPEALFESEMFGHEKGAFTGAVGARDGLMLAAAGGTFFLDEVGDLPLAQQAKLLTVVEDGVVRRVGGERTTPTRCRIVAATGRDLLSGAYDGTFRRDLLHRLTVLRCTIPPLRDRPDDMERLARRVLKRLARRYGIPGLRLNDAAWGVLRAHPWPGNVRELEHVLEGAALLSRTDEFGAADLQLAMLPVRE